MHSTHAVALAQRFFPGVSSHKVTAPTSALERLASLHAPASVTGLALEVLCFLLRSISRTQLHTWYAQTAIAQRLRRSERSVRSALAELELLGLIHRVKRNRPGGRMSDLTSVPYALELERLWLEERAARQEARKPPPAVRLVRAPAPVTSVPTTPAEAPASHVAKPEVSPVRAPVEAPRPPLRVVPARSPAEPANLAAILCGFTESPPARISFQGTSVSPPTLRVGEGIPRAPLDPSSPAAQLPALPPPTLPPLAQAAAYRRAHCEAAGVPWRPVRADEHAPVPAPPRRSAPLAPELEARERAAGWLDGLTRALRSAPKRNESD